MDASSLISFSELLLFQGAQAAFLHLPSKSLLFCEVKRGKHSFPNA